MILPTLSLDHAGEALERRREAKPWSGSPLVRWIGTGSKFAEDRVDTLYSHIEELVKSFGVDPLPANKGGDFEARACPVVHQSLGLDPSSAPNREFWLWLTFVASEGRFTDFVDWRFGTQAHIANVNYGIGSKSEIWEGLFARLWLRGNIGRDPMAAEAYGIAKRGGIDIWRSHVIRQEYGRCHLLARQLVRYQHPDSDPDSRTLTVAELRELAKRLRVVDASVSYEVLDESQIEELIERNVGIVRSGPRGVA